MDSSVVGSDEKRNGSRPPAFEGDGYIVNAFTSSYRNERRRSAMRWTVLSTLAVFGVAACGGEKKGDASQTAAGAAGHAAPAPGAAPGTPAAPAGKYRGYCLPHVALGMHITITVQ